MESDIITNHKAYGQFSNLTRVRDAYGAEELPLPLDVNSLRALSVPESGVFSTKKSLEDLGWFDEGQLLASHSTGSGSRNSSPLA